MLGAAGTVCLLASVTRARLTVAQSQAWLNTVHCSLEFSNSIQGAFFLCCAYYLLKVSPGRGQLAVWHEAAVHTVHAREGGEVGGEAEVGAGQQQRVSEDRRIR